MESMLRFDPSCNEARPMETEFDGADKGVYSVKLSYYLSLLINFKMRWSWDTMSFTQLRDAAEDLALWSFKECKLIVRELENWEPGFNRIPMKKIA